MKSFMRHVMALGEVADNDEPMVRRQAHVLLHSAGPLRHFFLRETPRHVVLGRERKILDLRCRYHFFTTQTSIAKSAISERSRPLVMSPSAYR